MVGLRYAKFQYQVFETYPRYVALLNCNYSGNNLYQRNSRVGEQGVTKDLGVRNHDGEMITQELWFYEIPN